MSDSAAQLTAPGSRLAAGVQGELVPLEDLPDEFFNDEAEGKSPRYTARLFFRRRPQDYQRTVQLIAAGMDITEVARIMHVHHRTVAAVRDAEGGKIDTYKQTTISNLRVAVEVLSGDLAEDVRRLPIAAKALNLGILIDKLAMLEESAPSAAAGEPVTAHLTHAAVLSALSQLPAVDVQAVPVSTGSSEPRAAQKGADLEAAVHEIPSTQAPSATIPADDALPGSVLISHQTT